MVTTRDKKVARRMEILNKPLFPLLVKMAIPTIIGMMVHVLYNLTDTFFIGLLDNKSMTAAIGVVFSFVSIIQAVGFWFGYGSGNVMSRKLGAKEDDEAEITSSLGIVLALGTGLVLALLSGVFVDRVAGFIGGNASKSLLFFTTAYLKLIIVSIPFILYSITIYNQLRLCGNAKDGMLGLLAGMLSNIALDPIFIFVCKMGFIGAGYATLAGNIIGSVVLTLLAEKNGNIPVRLYRAKWRKNRMYHILAGGSPNFLRQGITSVAMVMLNIVAAGYSEAVVAGLTVSSRIVAFPYMMMIGWSQGFQPICAMNYGAKQYDRVKKGYRLTITVGTVFLLLASAILFVFASTMAGYMSRNDDVVVIAVQLIRWQCLSLPFMAFLVSSSMFMQNVASYFSAMTISTSRQGTFFIPLLFLLPAIFGQSGIYFVQPVADMLSFVLTIVVITQYFSNHKWE